MSENVFQKFRDKFIEEAIMLLDGLEKDLLELEKDPEEKELLESAFRAMHTIKGVSGMYGFTFISDFTHVLENIYQSLRDKKIKFSKEISDLSFAAIDHIRKLLDDEKLTIETNQHNQKHLLARINTFATLKPENKAPLQMAQEAIEASPTKQSWYIILNANEQIFFRGISLTNIFKELSLLGEYYIQQIPVLGNTDIDVWGIVLVSECTIDDVREVFMFIEDDCQIFKITSSNIFEYQQHEANRSAEPVGDTDDFNEPSLMDLIEAPDRFLKPSETHKDTLDEPQTAKVTQFKQQLKRISVDAAKLDHLMYLVSELITVNSQLLLATKNKKFEELRPFIETVDGLSKKFRNNAIEIRLVPLSDTALRFQRLIRDLSKSLNKKVEFLTEGIDTELDKNTIDLISEPLMHIVRNCIDHGIEEPQVRKTKGKPETGTLKLSASQSGNAIFIKVEDDGGGIDLERVRKKAIEKGILKTNDKPTKKELLDIIFLPGFSTAQSLTEVSGRGVGMDVVRKKITDLRGEIFVDSELGKGTSFTLKLQQSLAIIDTLLFRVEKSYFIAPLSDIVVCEQIDIKELNSRRHTSTIPYNDDLIPFVDLRQLMQINGAYGEKTKMVIVRNEDITMALLSDAIIGEHQAVLKPMGKSFDQEKFISSASQLGDGNIAFMIDTGLLSKRITQEAII